MPGPRQSLHELKWRQFKSHFAAALKFDHRSVTLDAVKAEYLRGRYVILGGSQSALLVEIVTINGHRHLHAYLGGGELGEMVGVLFPRAEIVAAHYYCKSLIITGRKGWARALAHRGYLTVQRYPGWSLVAKRIYPTPLKDRSRAMSCNNFSLAPRHVALATDGRHTTRHAFSTVVNTNSSLSPATFIIETL